MRLRNFLIAVAALVIAVPAFANAAEPTGFKVTGGGQIISDAQEAEGGPGDTVGFNAQEITGDDDASPDSDDAARGQFQYVPRDPDEGGNQPVNEKFHGVVTCLISGGEADVNEQNENDDEDDEQLVAGMARFGGYVRGTEGSPETIQYFTVDVTDNGQGGDAEDDLILVRWTEQPCADNPENEDEDEPEELLELGRGNVKIHNNPDDETSEAATALAIASLVRDAQ